MPDRSSDALVLFGASGDLAHKMLFPALYVLEARGRLDIPIVAVAKGRWSREELRGRARALFAPAAEALGRAGCARGARLCVEKPFGNDLASARDLDVRLLRVFDESAIDRVDRYLAMDAVQNLLFSPREPVRRRDLVAALSVR